MKPLHRVLVGLAVGLLVSVPLMPKLTRAEDTTSTSQPQAAPVLPPAAPTGVTATFSGQAVTVRWQAAVAGDHPVASYVVSRSDDQQAFTDIGTATDLAFQDNDGHAGQYYRVRALDDQSPANESSPSDSVAAAEPKPAPAEANPDIPLTHPANTDGIADHLVPTPEPAVVPAVTQTTTSTDLEKQATKDMKDIQTANMEAVPKVIDLVADTKVVQLNQAVVAGNDTAVAPLVTQFKSSKQILFKQYPSLSPPARSQAVTACQQQERALETTLNELPQELQVSVYEALATCHLIEEQP